MKQTFVFIFQLLNKFTFISLNKISSAVFYIMTNWKSVLLGIWETFSLFTHNRFSQILVVIIAVLELFSLAHLTKCMYGYVFLVKALLFLLALSKYLYDVYCIGCFIHSYIRTGVGFYSWARIVSLPHSSKVITLLRSPHVHKKARDQYVLRVFKRSFKLFYLKVRYPQLFRAQYSSAVTVQLQQALHSLVWL